MKRTYLEFEKPVETLEAKIESLKKAHDDHPTIDVNKELNSLQENLEAMQHKIFDNLTAWQISQVSRHPQRPYTKDYIEAIFKNFKDVHVLNFSYELLLRILNTYFLLFSSI